MRNDIRPPAEFADAVELYARRTDRHGTLKFIPPPVNCWVVQLSLKGNNPLLGGWQGQKLEEEPCEPVYLWRPSTPKETAKAGREHFVGYKLDELGVTGMIALLEQTDTFSGRGQYASQKDAIRDQANKAESGVAKLVDEARKGAVEVGLDKRRQVFGIPYLGVGIDLKHKAPESAPGDE